MPTTKHVLGQLKLWALGALTGASVLASGCAAGGGMAGLAAQADPVYGLLGADASAAQAAPARPGQRGHHRGPRGLVAGPLGHLAADLGLDEAQKAKLKAILQEARQGQDLRAQFAARRQELKGILGAPQVDGVALGGWLNAREAELLKRLPERVALAARLREVLTEAQRAQLAAKLEAAPAGRGAGAFAGLRQGLRDRLVALVAPNEAQKAALQALSAKMEALQSQGGPASRQALAAFVRTGQAAPLEAALRAQLTNRLPKAELVAVATSLDANQRAKLMAAMARQLGAGRRPHGPRRPRGAATPAAS